MKTESITIRISPEMKARLFQMADDKGLTLSGLLSDLILGRFVSSGKVEKLEVVEPREVKDLEKRIEKLERMAAQTTGW
jgi:antitoxin component of RelBE/YafQ-DinJ toxin-antitoxin module